MLIKRCFKTRMTALETVLNASIQIEDNRKTKKTYSFRFNNNQVCKHVELHRSSLPVNFRFFRCGLIKRRCESDPICHDQLFCTNYQILKSFIDFLQYLHKNSNCRAYFYLDFFFILKDIFYIYDQYF